MDSQEYARMHALETDYWWFAGRRALIGGLLRAAQQPEQHSERRSALHLLDIGCGTGANLPLLRGHVGRAGCVIGLDFSPLALRFARDRLNEQANKDGCPPQHDARLPAPSQNAPSQNAPPQNVALLQGDALRLPFPDAAFDLVTMLDVLEHLRDDRGALREVSRVLRPGSALVLSVPAYQKLWSAHDEALHHFRRYEFHDLRRLLRASGFEVPLLSFAMSLMPPVAWLWRRLVLPFQPRRPRDARRHSEGAVLPAVPPALNRLLIAYLELEGKIVARRPLRFGTSLVAVAKKGKGQK